MCAGKQNLFSQFSRVKMSRYSGGQLWSVNKHGTQVGLFPSFWALIPLCKHDRFLGLLQAGEMWMKHVHTNRFISHWFPSSTFILFFKFLFKNSQSGIYNQILDWPLLAGLLCLFSLCPWWCESVIVFKESLKSCMCVLFHFQCRIVSPEVREPASELGPVSFKM